MTIAPDDMLIPKDMLVVVHLIVGIYTQRE